LTTTASSVSPGSPAAAPALSGLSHVALTVSDLAVSVAWYEQVFGQAPVLDEDTGPFRHVVFALGSTLFGLHTFPEGQITDVEFSPRRVGLDHVSFGCENREELVRWAANLDRLGVQHGGVQDAGYGSGLSFKDPDGLPLEIFCPPSA
jgi:glyoxylase I family protein